MCVCNIYVSVYTVYTIYYRVCTRNPTMVPPFSKQFQMTKPFRYETNVPCNPTLPFPSPKYSNPLGIFISWDSGRRNDIIFQLASKQLEERTSAQNERWRGIVFPPGSRFSFISRKICEIMQNVLEIIWEIE